MAVVTASSLGVTSKEPGSVRAHSQFICMNFNHILDRRVIHVLAFNHPASTVLDEEEPDAHT
jgi:hypothetical protein